MKKVNFLKTVSLTGLLFLAVVGLSQNNQKLTTEEKRNKIETHRIAFITEKLDLSVEEAQMFWPVYNENRKKVDEERKNFRENSNFSSEDILLMSDEDAKKHVEERLNHEQRMLDNKMEYNENLKKALSPQKILLFFATEMEFRENLIRQVSGKRGIGKGSGTRRGTGDGSGKR